MFDLFAKKEIPKELHMIQFLSLIEKLGSEVNAQNIEQFVALIEKLITLAETIKSDVQKSN